MLEKDVVQQRRFHDVYQNGMAVGFQVGYRSTYYRGIWLSLSTGFTVTVDGEKFPGDQVKVTVGGKTYTQEEVKEIGNVQRPNYEAAILPLPGLAGWKPGVHEVGIQWGAPNVIYVWPWGGTNALHAGGERRPGSSKGDQQTPTRKLVLAY